MNESFQSLKLINRKQFYISALVGGPMMAGFVAGHNFWNLKQKGKAFQMVLWGLVLTLLFEVFITLLITLIFRPLGMDRGILITLMLAAGGQLIFALLISQLLKVNKLKNHLFPKNADYYGRWRFVPILLLSLAYLLVHLDMPMLFAHFPNMILFFYLMPHFYFYNKIKYISRSSLFVIVVRWIIVAMACYMPLVFVLNSILPREIMDIPMFLAEYYIYTLLYLFLFILGVDILGKLALKFRLLPVKFVQNPIIKTASLIMVMMGVTLVMIEGNIRFNHIVVNSYDIQIQAKDAEIDSLKICFVADMHLNNHTSHGFIDDYINQVLQINPDILLYGGDMVESGRISKENLAEFDKQQLVLQPKYGKYIVSGNHDPFKYKGYNKALDLNFLTDTVLKVANSFYLMGLRYRSFEKKPISKLKELAEEDLPIFLLDHSPYQLDVAAENNIDIQLSGHTHNGQVWPINYIIELLYELPWGYKKIVDSHFFVTSGIQGWGTPIRTIGQSEIMVINVTFVVKKRNIPYF